MLQICWNILGDTAIYILVGFAIAGLLHAWLGSGWTTRALGRRGARSVIFATLFGAPLPLCSCGVLPAAVTLRRKGASKGATLSFLISTPETSVTSVLLTYSLLGPLMAIYRPIAACVTALVAGLVENAVDRSAPAVADDPMQGEDSTCCCGTNDKPASEAIGPPASGVREGLRFAFVDLFDDIFMWIVASIAVAAAIQAWLPQEVLRTLFGGPITSMLLMLAISVPLYVCAEGSTPIAAALIMQGVNPGAALVLLLAGPATNIGALGVLHRELGRRTVIVYLASIVIITLLMGGLLNLIVGQGDLPLMVRSFGEPLVPAWIKSAGAILFLVLGVLTVRRQRYWPRIAAGLDARLPIRVTPRGLLVCLVIVVLLAGAGSGFFTVQPGEVGIVKRFGAITRSGLAPGVHYAWPYPIEVVDRVPVRHVYRMELGADARESWLLTGDENIADLKVAVHWGAIREQAIAFQYGVEDRARLVRSVTLGALREVLGGASINRVFTANRRTREVEIGALIQQRLDEYGVGIRIDSFHFLDAHAPPEVHAAFRDVASALEDKSMIMHRALAEQARIVPLARGEAARLRAGAESYAAYATLVSRGEAQRFVDLLPVHGRWPALTCLRLYFETLDRVLPGITKYIKATGPDAGEIDIWLMDPQVQDGLPWQPAADR